MKNIYITWHYTTHGIAYLKHILSAFYCGKCSITDNRIRLDNISQDEMNEVFEKIKSGFLFDKVYYLTAPQASFDKISSRRFYYRKNILEDKKIHENNLIEVWNDIIHLNWIRDDECLQKELKYVKEKYPERYPKFKELLWRDMQHYSINSQIHWFKKLSNAARFYSKRFEEKNFDIKDLRNSEEIARKIYKWVLQLPKKHPDAKFIINVALGSNETQVVWHILAEAGLLPPNTKLLLTYDDKSDMSENRFKKVSIHEVPINLISSIKQTVKLYDSPISGKRKIAGLKLQNYLKQGFAILVLGERGIGKTHLVEENKGNDSFVEVNCASFDDDTKAESELFGYEKGAFTGAEKQTDGLFHAANGGIIFLDEFHHLSKRVQAKLMKAIQTDENNNMFIRRMGSTSTNRVRCKIIMASNKTVEELKKNILPDFYDRISQLIIELPPLRESPDDRIEDWKATWYHMKFHLHPELKVKNAPVDNSLIEWLKTLPLLGNFRDLQKIAISYHTYLTFSKELKALLPEKSAFEYAKSEFQKYHSTTYSAEDSTLFSTAKTPTEMIKEFKRKIADWAINIHNGAPNAEKYFKKQGDKITARTLYQWKNSN